MNYKYKILILSLLLHINTHAWIGNAVHFVGGALEVMLSDKYGKKYSDAKTVKGQARCIGYIAIGLDALLRGASHVPFIGDNMYIKRTLQVMPLPQAIMGVVHIKNNDALKEKIQGAIVCVDGVWRLCEAYASSRKQQQDEKSKKPTRAPTPSS